MRSRSDASAPPEHNSRIVGLDGLRFLAALSVVLFHLLAVAGALSGTGVWGRPSKEVFGAPAFFVASYGWVGVPLFFMISGFVISMSSWGRTVGQFAASRFVRLFPAYWVCIAITTAVATLHSKPYEPLPWRSVLTNLTMLQEPLGVHTIIEPKGPGVSDRQGHGSRSSCLALQLAQISRSTACPTRP